MRLGGGLFLLGLAALLAALGLGLLLWGLLQALIFLWGEVIATFVAGAAALFLAGVLAWIAQRMNR
jgi:hypothetical protein